MIADTLTLTPTSRDAHPEAEEPPGPRSAEIRALSERLGALVRPLRVLDAVRWTADVEDDFFARGGRELPRVAPDYYDRRPLPFDPSAAQLGLVTLERDIARRLGRAHPAARLMLPRCKQARLVIDLLAAVSYTHLTLPTNREV